MNTETLPIPNLCGEFRRPQIVKTKDLRLPNQYTLALDGELRDYAFNEMRAPENKTKWRQIFGVAEASPVDLEIGTGNGLHFDDRCKKQRDRNLVGLELKFKPLVQTVRGMLRGGSTNGRLCRAHAFNIDTLFASQELNHIFMHFPDPWTTPRKPRNRMVNDRMVPIFYDLQRPGSEFELKTDSQEYFRWASRHFADSKYELIMTTDHWHAHPDSESHIRTQFEKIFARQGLPIYYAKWRRP